MNKVTSAGSFAQISKIHTCIRELANEGGYTFEEMKSLIKQRSGLCIVITENDEAKEIYKSFAECTKDELSMAIQACIEIGEIYNINLA
jgi:acetate kinase